MPSKEQKFQIYLALIVFGLTIIASVISGCVVYKLTEKKDPVLYLDVLDSMNELGDDIEIIVGNIGTSPATNVVITFGYSGLSSADWYVDSPISILNPGERKNLSLKVSKLMKYMLLGIVENKLEGCTGLKNESIVIVSGTNLSRELNMDCDSNWDGICLDMIFEATCNNCKRTVPNQKKKQNPVLLLDEYIECERSEGACSCHYAEKE